MKKEAVNTFQQGLNYDLNPITTPNNVLTDCVNGSFVTFNGDELALQNDAGNTKIVSQFRDSDGDPAEMWEGIYTYSIGSIVYMPEDPDKYYIKTTTEDTIPTTLIGWNVYIPSYVKLTDRFYPLGIKEYGGVLYIVSGCDYYEIDLIATDWDEKHPYKKGDIVRYQGYYFRSLKDNNTTSLADPIFSEVEEYIMLHKDSSIMSFESDWEWINESELGKKIQKVEFGSYPSPQFSGYNMYSGIEKKFTSGTDSGYTSTTYLLYQPTIINNEFFKSSRYIKFSNFIDIDTSNISYYYFTQDVIKFYKVKLWHQLSNGFLDLTSDVVSKYNTYRKSKGLTYLTRVIVAGSVTSINVDSTEGFSDSGTVYIGQKDKFIYTSKTATSFIGESQTLLGHAIGDNVYNTSNFWFNEADFKYYCPNQYKGKLAISLEIEGIDTFKLLEVPTLRYISTTESKLTLANVTGFPTSGKVLIGNDLIPYTAITNNDLTIAEQVWNSHDKGESVYLADVLGSSIPAGSTTLVYVNSTDGFPNTGALKIGNDTFFYTSKTTNSFSGIAQVLESHKSGESVGSISVSTTLGALLGPRYNYKIKVNYKSSNPLLPAENVEFKLYSGNDLITSKINSVTNDVATFSYDLSESTYRERVISYTVNPEWKAPTEIRFSDFPQEWQSKFILTGNRLISTSTDKVSFLLYEGSCNTNTLGIKDYYKVVLTDQAGNYIDKDQTLTTDEKWVFVKKQTPAVTLAANENKLGEYTVGEDGYPVVDMSSIYAGLSDSIIQLFQQIKVSVYDVSCDIQTVDLSLFGVNDPARILFGNSLRVIQDGKELTVYHKESDSNMRCYFDCHVDVRPGIPFRIFTNVQGYEPVDIPRTATYGGVSKFNIAMVQSLGYFEYIDTSITNRYIYTLQQIWFPGSYTYENHNAFTDGTVTVKYGSNYTDAVLYSCGFLSDGLYYIGTEEDGVLARQTFVGEQGEINWTVVVNLDVSNDLNAGYYTNISAESDYMESSGSIYRKEYQL